MQPEQARGLFDFLMPQIEQEQRATRRVVQAVPADKASYSPDPVSKNAGDLAWHLLSSEIWFLQGISRGSFDASEPSGETPKTPAEMLAWYDESFPPVAAAVKALPSEKLAEVVDFFGMKFPLVIYLQFMLKHTVHHRGQLSAYLRAMGSKVPDIYGGSADEPFQMTAAQ